MIRQEDRMQQRVDRIRRLFTVSIVGLCIASMLSLLLVLYISSAIGFSETTSPEELESLVAGYPAVANYLEEQKDSQAHFITLGNLIKDDQQQMLGRAALMAAVPLLLASALLGYLLARYLLRPVTESYDSQERFLQDAAHELRNPLATMSAVIQQARQSGNKEDAAAQLDILERQTEHLVRMNEDLLFLERKNNRSAEPIDVSELLRDVAETLQADAHKKGVKIKVIGENVTLAIHPDDFICLARNIIENAIKYSKENVSGIVTASIVMKSKTVVLRIDDQGIGIPVSELPRIGERFYRAGNVARRPGTGLGFAIVRKVAADYNADVKIESTPNKGTTVIVLFKI